MRAPTSCTGQAGSAAATGFTGEPICFHCPARMSDLCAGVPDTELKLLAAISTHLHMAPGETLILDGDASDNVYNVVSGTLMMTRLGADGRRQILAFLPTGSFVGFSSDQLYRFNVEAVSGAELCRFERKKLEPLFDAYPEMERRFRQMAARVIEASLDLVFTLGRRNATERIAAFLLHLRDTQRESAETPPGPHHAWSIPMTRTDIADYLGLTIETVSRVLSRLKAKGVIRLPTLHSFEIADEAQTGPCRSHGRRIAGARAPLRGTTKKAGRDARPFAFLPVPEDQKLILARDRTVTALVPLWPCEVHLVTGIGLQRQGAVEEGRHIAQLDIGLRRRAGQRDMLAAGDQIAVGIDARGGHEVDPARIDLDRTGQRRSPASRYC